MKKYSPTLATIFCILSLFVSAQAYAQPPDTVPHDVQQNFIMNFDRATLPSSGKQTFFDDDVAAYTQQPSELGKTYNEMGFTCLDESNSQKGACAVKIGNYAQGSKTDIKLRFTEQRSGMQVDLLVTGQRVQMNPTNACGSPTFHGDNNLNSRGWSTSFCSGGEWRSGAALNLWLDYTQLSQLPVGGKWQANLVMHFGTDVQIASTYNINFTVDLTDNNNQQIYLPEFGQAAPHVDLNMRPLPGTQGNQAQMNGAANIDMCLYDGYGSNSTSFTLKFDDQQQGTIQRNNGYFSIYSDHGDVNQDSGRIDYYVKMQAPDGKYVSIIRGEDLVIPNIQTARVRPVHLPGIPQAVLCIPAPLELSTKTLDINSKQAGHYTGHLIVNFTSQL
ncbi:CfaE/CblD family pilus tip adhesin [Rahnella sp. PD4]|uniref:CfaE/CblD family pilus tip adhesin n=1 Tax=Rahnella sp. PD4 TaxID=3368611 RepID=UPI003BA3A4B5